MYRSAIHLQDTRDPGPSQCRGPSSAEQGLGTTFHRAHRETAGAARLSRLVSQLPLRRKQGRWRLTISLPLNLHTWHQAGLVTVGLGMQGMIRCGGMLCSLAYLIIGKKRLAPKTSLLVEGPPEFSGNIPHQPARALVGDGRRPATAFSLVVGDLPRRKRREISDRQNRRGS